MSRINKLYFINNGSLVRVVGEIRKLFELIFKLKGQLRAWNGENSVDKGTQILLSLKYRELLENKQSLPPFDQIQFRNMSQNGEDGILLYIFSLIGTTNKKVVEICAGDGIECNAANLIINHGWTGLLFDGNSSNIKIANSYYSRCRDTHVFPPKLVEAWISVENVNTLITKNGFVGKIDLLSLDMDGNDYWILNAISSIRPRVIVLEFNDILGKEKALTIPYDPKFVAKFTKYGPSYSGASIKAFTKLMKRKGYRLVGVERYGFNAFFVLNGIGDKVLPAVKTSACLNHPKNQFELTERLAEIRDKKWVEV